MEFAITCVFVCCWEKNREKSEIKESSNIRNTSNDSK